VDQHKISNQLTIIDGPIGRLHQKLIDLVGMANIPKKCTEQEQHRSRIMSTFMTVLKELLLLFQELQKLLQNRKIKL